MAKPRNYISKCSTTSGESYLTYNTRLPRNSRTGRIEEALYKCALGIGPPKSQFPVIPFYKRGCQEKHFPDDWKGSCHPARRCYEAL
jgi:hypothetical protein